MKHHLRRRFVVGSLAIAIAFLPAAIDLGPCSHAQRVEVLALTGDTAPNGNGEFSAFGAPVLNDLGQAAFVVSHAASVGFDGQDVGVYLAGDTVTQIVRAGQAAPDGNGTFSSLIYNDTVAWVTVNEAGQVGFRGTLAGTAAGFSDNEGLFLGDGQTITQIAREGQPAADSNRTYRGFTFLGDLASFPLNNAGQVVFASSLNDPAHGPTQPVIIRSDGVVETEFATFPPPQLAPTINDAGQVASFSSAGVLRSDGITSTVVASSDQASPVGNAAFSGLTGSPVINDVGQIAFLGNLLLQDEVGSPFGIFLGDGDTVLEIVRSGQPAPDGNGAFFVRLFMQGARGPRDVVVALNNVGQAAFFTTIVCTDFFTGIACTEEPPFTSIFRGDGTVEGLVEIARGGGAAPGGGEFFVFGDRSSNEASVAINDLGQVAFLATVVEEPQQGSLGIFLYDDRLGLIEVARTGDPLLGSTITWLVFEPGGVRQDEGSGFNELGQVAYAFELADGRGGIALYTPPVPEPGSLCLAAAALAVGGLRRRRS
ncbi:MAG: choice-of-anchor tandem repeat NxxGxxAF-containing protein [Planctomycetota bacterium]